MVIRTVRLDLTKYRKEKLKNERNRKNVRASAGSWSLFFTKFWIVAVTKKWLARHLSSSVCLWAGGYVNAILPHALGFLQGGLNTKVCPGFHGVVFVILSVERRNIYFLFSLRASQKTKIKTQLTIRQINWCKMVTVDLQGREREVHLLCKSTHFAASRCLIASSLLPCSIHNKPCSSSALGTR